MRPGMVICSGHSVNRTRGLRKLGRRQKSIEGGCVVHCLSRRRDFTRRIFHAILVAFSVDLGCLLFHVGERKSEHAIRIVVPMEQQNADAQTDDEGEERCCALKCFRNINHCLEARRLKESDSAPHGTSIAFNRTHPTSV